MSNNIVEGVLMLYGVPGSWPNFTIITKQAAINAAQQAKEQGKIIDYRVEEMSVATGKIIATMHCDTTTQIAIADSESKWSIDPPLKSQ